MSEQQVTLTKHRAATQDTQVSTLETYTWQD
jgi:hypothetical protein